MSEHLDRSVATAAERAGWDDAATSGFPGLTVPATFGGRGLDPRDAAEEIERLARNNPDIGGLFGVGAHLLACVMPVYEHGSSELREGWLPALATGELVAGNAMTEAEAGSDIGNLRTTARVEGDGFVIRGEKTFVTNAPFADVFLVYVQTDENASFLGNSCFLIERERSGITVGATIEKLGMQTALAASVTFDDVWVPSSNLVGELGQGNLIFQDSMRWERTLLPAVLLGRMTAVISECLAFTRSRRQFGNRIIDFQAVSHRLARMHVRTELSRAYLRGAAEHLGREDGEHIVASVAKYAVTQAAVEVGRDAMEIFASAGYRSESPAAQLLSAALGALTYSGTNDIQLEIIQRSMAHAY